MLYEVKIGFPSGNTYKCFVEASSARDAIHLVADYGLLTVSKDEDSATSINVRNAEYFQARPMED